MRPAHYMIHVRDLDRAVTFYQNALGLVVADRHEYPGARLVYMRVPSRGFEIELIMPDRWAYAEQPEAGRVHIAFAVDDLDGQHARLAAQGVNVDPITDYVANGIYQTRYFYFTDPEGNQIEFLAARGRYGLSLEIKEPQHAE